MSSRVGGAVLALAAAALLAVPMATSIALDSGGWWSGHPTVMMQNGERREISAKSVDVSFFAARGCNTGGDQKCEHLSDKLPTGFTWTGLIEAILTGVAAVIAIGLGITSYQNNEGRKILAKLMAAALALSVVGGIALVLQGPKFKGADVSVPFAWVGGFGMFLGAVMFAGISSVLATREVRVRVPKPKAIKPPKPVKQPKPPKPVKQPKPKPIKPPRPVHQPVTVAQMQPPPQEPFDVQQLLAQDALRPASLGPEPMLGRAHDPYAATMNQPPSSQPLFQQAPQLRPLYEQQGDGFVPNLPPTQLPMRPPTPISREELGAMMHGEINNPAAAIVEQRNSKPPTIPPQMFPPPQPLFAPQSPPPVVMSTKPSTIPPGVSSATTMPPPSAIAGELPSLPSAAGSMPPVAAGSVVPEMSNPNESQRLKPATLPPPKVAPAIGTNGPRPSVPMPRPTALGTVPAAARTSGTIPPAIGKTTPPKSQPTIAAAVVPPPPPAIPAPPTFVKPDRSETESEDFDSATAQNKSPGESTDATGKPFETEEPVAMLPIHPKIAADNDDDEAKTVRAPSTKIAKAMDDMHEAVTVRAPSKKPDDLHEAVTVRAPKTPKPKLDDDDDEAKTTHMPKTDRSSVKEIGLSTGDSTIQLQKEDPVETSAALPGSIAAEPEPPPEVPAPPVIVPTLTSMARALRQKRSAERQRERTETNLKAIAASEDADNDAPIAPPSVVPITTASSTLPPPTATQTATSGPSPACPQCEAPMGWVEEHLRFYCKACRMYF